MTKRKVTAIFALLGTVIPVMFLIGTSLYTSHRNDYDVNVSGRIEDLMLALWPSSILTMANDDAKPGVLPYVVVAISIAINALLYSCIGLCLWLGRHKHKAFFLVPVVLLLISFKLFYVP